MKRIDLVGKTFGTLTVIEKCGKNNRNEALWKCVCVCGKEKITSSDRLKSYKTTTCGSKYCKALSKNRAVYDSNLYQRYTNMKLRCYYPKFNSYPRYGGRGITVCDEWMEYKNFRDWALQNGYSKNLELDRIDNNGNYCPENCRWVTRKQNNFNKRNNHYITIDGTRKTITEWCEIFRVSTRLIFGRVSMGWDEKDLFLPPIKKGDIARSRGRFQATVKRGNGVGA